MTLRLKLSPLDSDALDTGMCASLDVHRSLVAHARKMACRRLVLSRSRAHRHRKLMQSQAERSGYQAGLAAARTEFKGVIEMLAACRQDALMAGSTHVTALAKRLAEELLSEELTTNLDHYRRWIEDTAKILRRSSNLTLEYHPRLRDTIGKLAPDYELMMTFRPDPSLGSIDVRLTSEIGSVELAWREALARCRSLESEDGTA